MDTPLAIAVVAPIRPPFDPGGGTAAVHDPSAAVAADFAALGPTIERLVAAATHDPDAAADAAQEAFARLLREARAGRYPGNPRAWLFRTALNVVISARRRSAVANRMAPRLIRVDVPPGPDQLVLEHERSAAIRVALDRLSPTARSAVLMAAVGIPGDEIALHLGRTHGATRTLLCRTRGRLRRDLQGNEAAEAVA